MSDVSGVKINTITPQDDGAPVKKGGEAGKTDGVAGPSIQNTATRDSDARLDQLMGEARQLMHDIKAPTGDMSPEEVVAYLDQMSMKLAEVGNKLAREALKNAEMKIEADTLERNKKIEENYDKMEKLEKKQKLMKALGWLAVVASAVIAVATVGAGAPASVALCACAGAAVGLTTQIIEASGVMEKWSPKAQQGFRIAMMVLQMALALASMAAALKAAMGAATKAAEMGVKGGASALPAGSGAAGSAVSKTADATIKASTSASKEAVKQVVDKAAKAAAQQAIKTVMKEGTEAAADAAKTAATEAVKNAVTNASKLVMKDALKGVGTAVTKEVGEEIAKQVAEEVAKEAAKAVAKEMAEQAAKASINQATKTALTEGVKTATKEAIEEGTKLAIQETGKQAVIMTVCETTKKMANVMNSGASITSGATAIAAGHDMISIADTQEDIDKLLGRIQASQIQVDSMIEWLKSMGEQYMDTQKVIDDFKKDFHDSAMIAIDGMMPSGGTA